MNNLKQRRPSRNRVYLFLGLIGILTGEVRADRQISTDGNTVMVKALIGGDGSPAVDEKVMRGFDEPVAFGHAVGEPLGGHFHRARNFEVFSGYLGAAPLLPQTWEVNPISISNGIRVGSAWVGVPLSAPIEATFSSPVVTQCSTCPVTGITVSAVQNHMGQPIQQPVAYHTQIDASDQRVLLFPGADGNSTARQWQPNTLYDVFFQSSLTDRDGNPLNADVHQRFVTVLDPEQENVVLHPVEGTLGTDDAGAPASASTLMAIHLPAESLRDYSAVFLNTALSFQPAAVPDAMIQEANRKAERTYGGYRKPIAIHEVVAYDLQQKRQTVLKKPVSVRVSYGNTLATRSAAPAPSTVVRPETLSLFALDTTHQAWVKMGSTENDVTTQSLQASFSQLPVFAVMGGAAQSAAESKVFPNPWRPFGPRAGDDPLQTGQTGTLAGGMIFSDLPSECTIRIYTLNGEKVRELRHSDILGTGPAPGQERWDGNTQGGQKAASGVYLWHVESSDDEKTGKLMIIR